MRAILCLLGAALCCVFLSTCGTARQIEGDYDDDIEFVDILPSAGVSGEPVTFRSVFTTNSGFQHDFDDDETTDGKYIFLWEFGGGAEPNKVYSKEASVVLRDGLRAPYNGTLKVIQREGGEEETKYEFPFTFDVTALSVLAVRPTRVIQGGEATFSAIIGSGVVDSYAWDFGGIGTPGGSTDVNPTVEVTNQPGIYQCSVVVSNEFEVFEFPFTVVVDAAPVEEE